METLPPEKPVKEIEGTAARDGKDLLMSFEARYRNALQPIPEGAGHKTPGVHGPGWIHGLQNIRMYKPEVELTADFLGLTYDILEPGQTIFQAMFNRIGPQGFLDWHVDGPPYRERWHYIVTGETVYYQGDQGNHDLQIIHQRPGFWYGPISYWIPHAVNNTKEKERIALLVDIEREQ